MEAYIEIGSPKLEALSGWTIFNAMAPRLRAVVENLLITLLQPPLLSLW
jgi:hypothetical protein